MFDFEKKLPEADSHNIQGVENHLHDEYLHNTLPIVREYFSIDSKVHIDFKDAAPAARDKAVFSQMQGTDALLADSGNSVDGVIFLKDSRKDIAEIRKWDPTNADLPQLDLIQQKLQTHAADIAAREIENGEFKTFAEFTAGSSHEQQVEFVKEIKRANEQHIKDESHTPSIDAEWTETGAGVGVSTEGLKTRVQTNH